MDLDAMTIPHWPGKVPETPEGARELWEAYLRSLEQATDLRAAHLQAQAAHASDTMHVYRRVAELEQQVATLLSEISNIHRDLRHVQGWVAGQGRRIEAVTGIVQS